MSLSRRKIPRAADPGLVNSAGAARVLEISESTFYRYRHETDFPRPVQEGNRGRPALYKVEELLAWRDKRVRTAEANE